MRQSEPPGSNESPGIVDTSAFIAEEEGRPVGAFPTFGAVSVATTAELHLGVLLSKTSVERQRRLRTFSRVVERFHPLPITPHIAMIFAELQAEARRQGRRPKVMDVWIAATAIAEDVPVYTQDEGFQSIPRVRVVLI